MMISVQERPIIRGIYTIEKFEARQRKSGRDIISAKPFEIFSFENLITNVGGAIILDLFIGAGGTAFNNANAYIGIGDSLTAPAVGQTDLQAASNKLRKAMDATFPSRASQITTFKATFATTDANYTWNEIALFNASSVGTTSSRALVSNPFTKTSGLSIAASYTMQLP